MTSEFPSRILHTSLQEFWLRLHKILEVDQTKKVQLRTSKFLLAINETIFVSHKGYADWKIDIIKWLLYFLDTRFSDNPPMKWNKEKKFSLPFKTPCFWCNAYCLLLACLLKFDWTQRRSTCLVLKLKIDWHDICNLHSPEQKQN